ncbi:hypothetical protein [Gayadomonas joobiniege]|uniref:hypothetical protein n=1 Tax=Gayadomonas joobiniege TaxID=1234606 RepID=UPI0003727C69|nr:hypothetical protein [Gayadomonas joobiniege]
MEFFYIIALIVAFNMAVLIYQYIYFRNSPVFESEGACVRINLTPEVRFHIELPKYLQTDSIVKLRLAGNCLSLVNETGNSYDLWIEPSHLKSITAQAEKAFVNAELCCTEQDETNYSVMHQHA